jgi:predicted Zn finger-like uncharacterized protein
MEDGIEITCPNCKASLPVELKRVLVSGTAVTCENCGIVLVPKVQGQPSQVSPSGHAATSNRPTTASNQHDRARDVASKGRERCETRDRRDQCEAREDRLQPTRASEPSTQPTQPATPSPVMPRAVPGKLSSVSPLPQAGPSIPPANPRAGAPRKPPTKGTPEYVSDLKVKIGKGKAALKSFNEVSLNLMKLFLGLFYIISAAAIVLQSFFGQPGFNFAHLLTASIQIAPQCIIGAFMYWYETRRLHEWIKHEVYEFYGIDIIIVGIIGCTVAGIGVLLIIKGIMVMVIMISQDEITPRLPRDGLISWIGGFDEVSWLIAAIVSAGAFSIVALGLVQGLISLATPSPTFVSLVIMGICGIIAANGDLHDVTTRCRAFKFENLGGKALGYGIVGCICAGAGAPMIIKAILLLVLDGLDKKQPPQLLQQQQQQQAPDLGGAIKSPEPPLPRHETPAEAPLKPAPAPASIPAPVLVPGQLVKPTTATTPAATGNGETMARTIAKVTKTAPTLPKKASNSVEAFLQHSFNVLTPKVRKRLLKLRKIGVKDEDIEAIAEELVFHPEFEQLDIIEEYVQLNKAEEIDPVHVLAVRSMTYDENTKKWMLDQLKNIPDKDAPMFIENMRRDQPART